LAVINGASVGFFQNALDAEGGLCVDSGCEQQAAGKSKVTFHESE
jgi:hypothetical protein